MELRRLIPSPLPKKIVLLPLFLDISTSDENITKKIVLADHQLNEDEVEAVPAEGVEELPEAISIPVLGNSTESDSTESETSSQPRASCFLGLGCSWCWGCAQQFLLWRYNVTGWRCKCERRSGECVRVQNI